jgi:RNA polymerase sigma-70 factor (ECF subfamily)
VIQGERPFRRHLYEDGELKSLGMDLLRQWRGRTSTEEPPDLELVRQMRLGHEAALEALYARYGGLVYTLALRIVGDPELAREVLQDTFLSSWEGREAYDPQRGKVPWWLMGIARNRAIDLLRSRTHQARLRERQRLTPGPRAGAARQPAAQDEVAVRRVVLSALGSLSVGQRQAIELAYYGGLTQAEIAQELKEPLGTVKSRTREAMERLRQILAPLMDSKAETGEHRD